MAICRLLMLAAVICLGFKFAEIQAQNCPLIQENELGTTDFSSTTGLISTAYVQTAGDNTNPPSVRLFNFTIVCVVASPMRDRYTQTSVIASYTCTGTPSECTGDTLLSQFDLECRNGDWDASVGGSTENIITTPADGNLSTPRRTDCGVCVSPARTDFGTITDNEQHCGPCPPECNVGVMLCLARIEGSCCSFYNNSECVEQCPSPRTPDANFDCVLDCGNLPDPMNGQVVVNGTTPGSVATYSCSTGFRLNGASIHTCQTSAQWSESEPTCDLIDCGTLPDPNNGMVTLTGTGLGAEASYNCTEGFRINGTISRSCQMNDEWSGSEPTCDPIDCGPLRNPNNGSVDLTNSAFLGSQAFYRCSGGFVLNGNGGRVCQENSTWTGSDPVCEPINCTGLSAPRNGSVFVPSTTFTSVANYSCDVGFNLVGQTTRRCLQNRIWSGFAPNCEAVNCGILQVSNGTVNHTGGTRFPAVAIYMCNRGYNFSEDGSINRACQANGTWSGTPVECIAIPLPERVTVGPTAEPVQVDIAWIAAGICFFLLMILFMGLIIGFGIYRSKED